MKTFNLSILLALIAFPLCANADEDEFYYYNPVQATSLPDPTVIRADDGYFYLFATEDTHNVPIYQSPDLVNWTYLHTAFTNDTRPTFNSGMVWAPDINYINGQYVLYYTMGVWGDGWASGIGVATSDSVYGYYEDRGPLIQSEEIGVENSIDQFYIEDDDGKKYIFWGSFHGIYAIELSDDGLSLKEGAEKVQVSGTSTEGTCIYKHDGYYYLIGSAGSCCDGANSTYHLLVARSENILGPYVDKDGNSALGNNLSNLLYGNDFFKGPGHCSEVLEDDAGQTWLIYHGYLATGQGRYLFLDQVYWDEEGWPYIMGQEPSTAWDKPIFESTLKEYTYSDVDYIEFKGESGNNRYIFETSYVPKENTRIEVLCQSYPENEYGESAIGDEYRTIFSGHSGNGNGYALYINPDGNSWGYFVGGYLGRSVATHEFNTDYSVSADLYNLTINGDTYNTNRTSYKGTTSRITIFNGQGDDPYFGRIYSLKIYEDDELVHDYKPCLRNEDERAMFYDTVTETYMQPGDPFAFSYGYGTFDAITNILAEKKANSDAYNLSGQRVNNNFKGIVIQDGKKVIRQ